MHLLLTLESGTLLVVGIHDFGSEFLSHRFTGALAGVKDKVFHRNRNLALRSNLHRNLECRATDTLRLNFDLGRDILESLFPDFQRRFISIGAPQARRYYYNIVGKYGAQVQALLKKISALEIKTICPLHGPMLTEDLGEYLRLYDLWSQWKPEKPEGILIAHASIHGNTAYASEALKSKLEGKGAQVTLCDLTATNLSYAVTSAFYCGKLVLACSTYDGGLFPPMKAFLDHLQTKEFRNRRIGLMENGSWAPAAARLMRAELEKMKELRLCETDVSLRGALNQTSEAQMDALVAELCAE